MTQGVKLSSPPNRLIQGVRMRHIKRYANRKLYDTTDKKYITLGQIADLIKAGEEVVIVDNTTGKDITAATITQLLARDDQAETGEGAANVLIQMIRKGPETVLDYGKKYLSLWQRALTTAEGELDRLVNRLVREKELSEAEGSRIKREIVGHAEDFKLWIGKKIDQRISEAMQMMNLATKDHVDRLANQVKTLSRKVEKMEKASNRKIKAPSQELSRPPSSTKEHPT